MASEPFDAVLAELRSIGMFVTNILADRLAAAHAAEVAERDARIESLKDSLDAKRHELTAAWNSAEAAVRDARRYAWIRAATTPGYLHFPNGEMGDGLALDALDAAIDAAIATTEQADED